MSLILYLSGIYTGFYIQQTTIKYTEQRIQELEKRLENVQLEYMYLSVMGKDVTCNFLSVLVDQANREVWDIGKQLVSLENTKTDSDKVSQLTSEYSLLSIRAWILNTFVTEKCEQNKVVILYFYSVPCSDCIRQGNILDDLRDNYFNDKIRIFVLNTNSKESITQDLMKTYGISKTPSIILFNTTYVGFTNKEKLTDTINSTLNKSN